MARRGPNHSGPYGLACTHCFKSKSKCVARPGADGGACQRCHRLSKECCPSDSIRRRATGKKHNSSARIAQLENKLDGFISEFRSRDTVDVGVDGEGALSTSLQNRREPLLTTPSQSVAETTTALTDGEDGRKEHADVVGSIDLDPRRVPELPELSDDHADGLLSKFRSHMLPNFAFVHLSAGLTAEKLRTDRPLLFRAIVCVASPSASYNASQSTELKSSICDAMMGLRDKDQSSFDKMDILLGILTYLAWGWDQVFCRSSMSRLMMQAMSLAGELRLLDQSVPEGARVMEPVTALFKNNQSDSTGDMTPRNFLERQRAILGCFVLSSAVSAYFGHIDALRWTMQMEQGLAAISINKDCSTDASFALQVRLQVLADKGAQVHRQQEMDQGQALTEATTFPALMSLTMLQGQLQELQLSFSPHLSHRRLIVAHAHSAELSLNEITHAVTSAIPVMVRQFGRMAGGGSMGSVVDGTTNNSTARLERSLCLWQCVRSSKACALALISLAPSEFARVSFVQWAQLMHCIVSLDYLTNTIDDPAWDRHAVRAHVDMPELLDRVVGKLQSVAQLDGNHEFDNIFTSLAQKMHDFRLAVTSSDARQRRARGEADAAWERGRANAGGRGTSPASVIRLVNII